MKMIPVDIDSIDNIPKPRNDLKGLIEEFIAMDTTLVRLDGFAKGYADVKIAASCLSNSISKHGFNIKVFRKGSDIYLLKLEK